jgi:hypothetical protein
MKSNPICRDCKVILDSENWHPSQKKQNSQICKECQSKSYKQWREENPKRAKALQIKHSQQRAEKRRNTPFNGNKDCSSYLGVHVAERVLSKVFKDVEVMPRNHPGYDFICNKGKQIDVKSSCIHKDGLWSFYIKHNTTADYFLLLAFDNREDLNPLHAWLLPGDRFSHLARATISKGIIHKWDAYRIDISKISDCCDTMR